MSVTVGLDGQICGKRKKISSSPQGQLSGCWFCKGSNQGQPVSSGFLWLIHCTGCRKYDKQSFQKIHSSFQLVLISYYLKNLKHFFKLLNSLYKWF